jgi:uncharacterized paraquat-inducible protein A
MPWCEECAKYLTPSAMNEDGTCPRCGNEVDAPVVDEADEKAPWHFKLLIVAVVAYLVWRIVQLLG